MGQVIGLAALVLAVAGGVAAAAQEAAVKVTDAQVDQIVARAPKVPVDLGLDLPLRLVDFIDCTNPNDPHDMIDYGVSRVVEGPAGRYRVTAAHRHAYFAYRWRRDKQDQPHVLVFEYPDDAKREICFLTHESRLSGARNADWSLEAGVYCGNPFPLSGKMQYMTFFFWPADKWPAIIVANWNRSGAPAAASRIWVFAVDGPLPAAKVQDADPDNPRLLGGLYNWSLIPTRGIYGLTDPKTAFEHAVEYHAYCGHNVISWPVVTNNDWGFRCLIPAWDGGDRNDELGSILDACDRKGLKFIAVFNNGYRFKIGGKTYSPETKEQYAAGLRTGFQQFVKQYGSHKSLYGIAMDTQDLSPQYGDAALDCFRDCFDGDLGKFTAFIHGLKPDLKVFHFLGGRSIHAQYFPDGSDVITRWEQGQTPWPQYLADEVRKLWVSWKRDPAELKAAEGLTTILNYQCDDHAIFDAYYWNPRSMFHYDLDASPARSPMVDTRAVMVWNTFFEGWLGLYPAPESFWYLKEWDAPDFNPAPPNALAGWARAMMDRDRNVILAGAWGRKGTGHEVAQRRLAAAYRALPPVELQQVNAQGNTAVVVRAGVWRDRTYASVLNPTPFDAAVTVSLGGQAQELKLAPFELKALQAAGKVEVTAKGEAAAQYVEWIKGRLARYGEVQDQVRALDAAAAPPPFAEHLNRARALLEAGHVLDADVQLGHALLTELELRKRILQPPQTVVPRIQAAPPLNGSLDAWPKAAAEVTGLDSNITAHLYFPGSWHGPDDLSARVKLAHDGSKLYFGIEVRDDVLTAKDGLDLCLSQANYRQWLPQNVPYELRFSIELPLDKPSVSATGQKGFTYTTKRTEKGYVAEGSLDMKELGVASGSTLGWVVLVTEEDNTPHLYTAEWARKAAMLIPHSPTFQYWNDARTCCQLRFE
jgi:hypothetical protein